MSRTQSVGYQPPYHSEFTPVECILIFRPLVSCRRCQERRAPWVFTAPASLTSLRKVISSNTTDNSEPESLPAKPDTGPISDQTFQPVASGQLATCLGCRYEGHDAACTFNLGKHENVRIRPLFFPRARSITLVGPEGEVIHWNERYKHRILNLQDVVQLEPDSDTELVVHNVLESENENDSSNEVDRKRARSPSPIVVSAKRRRDALSSGSRAEDETVETVCTISSVTVSLLIPVGHPCARRGYRSRTIRFRQTTRSHCRAQSCRRP
jgi:hypothetical protein